MWSLLRNMRQSEKEKGRELWLYLLTLFFFNSPKYLGICTSPKEVYARYVIMF